MRAGPQDRPLTLALGVVYRTTSRQLINQAELPCGTGATGAAKLRQRYASALNLHVQFRTLSLGGVNLADAVDPRASRHLFAPDPNDLQWLVEQVAARVVQALERAVAFGFPICSPIRPAGA